MKISKDKDDSKNNQTDQQGPNEKSGHSNNKNSSSDSSPLVPGTAHPTLEVLLDTCILKHRASLQRDAVRMENRHTCICTEHFSITESALAFRSSLLMPPSSLWPQVFHRQSNVRNENLPGSTNVGVT